MYTDIIDADYETFVVDENGTYINHKPFILCAVST